VYASEKKSWPFAPIFFVTVTSLFLSLAMIKKETQGSISQAAFVSSVYC
jgi:uncharacterized membrane protein